MALLARLFGRPAQRTPFQIAGELMDTANGISLTLEQRLWSFCEPEPHRFSAFGDWCHLYAAYGFDLGVRREFGSHARLISSVFRDVLLSYTFRLADDRSDRVQLIQTTYAKYDEAYRQGLEALGQVAARDIYGDRDVPETVYLELQLLTPRTLEHLEGVGGRYTVVTDESLSCQQGHPSDCAECPGCGCSCHERVPSPRTVWEELMEREARDRAARQRAAAAKEDEGAERPPRPKTVWEELMEREARERAADQRAGGAPQDSPQRGAPTHLQGETRYRPRPRTRRTGESSDPVLGPPDIPIAARRSPSDPPLRENFSSGRDARGARYVILSILFGLGALYAAALAYRFVSTTLRLPDVPAVLAAGAVALYGVRRVWLIYAQDDWEPATVSGLAFLVLLLLGVVFVARVLWHLALTLA
jgi:hypothetical protein